YTLFVSVRLYGSLLALVVTHAVLGLPYVLLSVMAALNQRDPRLGMAALSLGASPWRAFREVTLPLAMPGVVGGGVLAFVVSVDAPARAPAAGPLGGRVRAVQLLGRRPERAGVGRRPASRRGEPARDPPRSIHHEQALPAGGGSLRHGGRRALGARGARLHPAGQGRSDPRLPRLPADRDPPQHGEGSGVHRGLGAPRRHRSRAVRH